MSEEAIGDNSPLATLYTALKSLDQAHYVRASKLLAAKRPGLVPIRDSVVEEFLGAGERWWSPYRELVTLDGLADRVLELSPTVPPTRRSFAESTWPFGWQASVPPMEPTDQPHRTSLLGGSAALITALLRRCLVGCALAQMPIGTLRSQALGETGGR